MISFELNMADRPDCTLHSFKLWVLQCMPLWNG